MRILVILYMRQKSRCCACFFPSLHALKEGHRQRFRPLAQLGSFARMLKGSHCVKAIRTTVNPVLSDLAKNDKTMILQTDGTCRLMQVESIAECSLGAFCNNFDLH